ncbi:MAG: MBL fold metallo-hydrolase [Planctomycetes bacterium]|nr:MBL fold metallo-hydrolase [Planctomycetota bacterium]
MLLRILGSGSAWPIPRVGCECPQCAAARTDRAERRTRSALLVNDRFLVDAGPDIYNQLDAAPRAALTGIEAVLLTHVHSDHFLGLSDLVNVRKFAAAPTVPILAAARNWPTIDATFAYVFDRLPHQQRDEKPPFVRQVVESGQTLRFGDLAVTPFEVAHSARMTTWGLRLTENGRSAAYLPDYLTVEANHLRGVELLLGDGAFLDEVTGRHAPMVETLALTRRLGIPRLVFTHLGHHQMSAPMLLAELLQYGPCELAEDGMLLEL